MALFNQGTEPCLRPLRCRPVHRLMLKRDSLAHGVTVRSRRADMSVGSTVVDPLVDNTPIESSANVLRTIPGQDGVILVQ